MANEFKIKKGLIVTGATGGTALDVQGSQGQLFSVTDNLSGSIFAVSDISGVPILDVNSSGLSTFAGTISSGAITSTSNIESQDTFILNYNNAGNKWQQLFDGSNGWNLRYYNATTEAWSSNYINVSTLGNTIFAGNVGIGIAPVSGARLTLGTGAVANEILSFAPASGGNAELRNTSSTGTFTFTNSNGSSEHMRIDSTGNVGIGHTVLYQKFTVNGNIDIRGGDGSFLTFNNGDANISIHNNDVGSVSGRDLSFKTWKSGVGNTEKMRIDRDGNVGIGTTSPNQDGFGSSATVLSIKAKTQGGSANTELIGLGNNDNDQVGMLGFMSQSATSPLATIRALRHTSDTSGKLTFDTAGSERMRIASNGNVGIGTTDPAVKLDFGSATGKAFHLYTSGVDYYGFNMLQYDSGPFSTNIIAGNGGEIKLRTVSGSSTQSTRLTVKAAGNVGIGTISPTSYGSTARTLEVRGASGTGTGLVRVSTADNSVGGALYAGSGGVVLNAQTNNSLSFATNNSEKMRITSAGNVGIGTTSPGAKLHVAYDNSSVYSTTSPSGDLVVSRHNTSNVDNQTVGIRFDTTGFAGTTTGQAAIQAIQPSNLSSADLAFLTRNNATFGERMRITASGNVGIGTASPERKLHVFAGESNGATSNTQSTLVLENSTNTYLQFLTPGYSDSGILFGDTDNDRGALTYSHSADAMNFRVAAATKMYINSSGNVGIGTTSPGFKLEVDTNGVHDGIKIRGANAPGLTLQDDSSASLSTILIQSTAAAQGNLRIAADTNNVATGATIEFQVSGSEKMRIDSAGNVGIGTTSPSETLEVSGKVRIFDGGYPYIDLGVSTSNYFRIIHDNPNDILKIGKNGATTSSSLIVQGGTGNVGIGGVPGSRFDVQGTQGQLFSVTDDLSGDIFSVADISGVPIMNVNSNGTIQFSDLGAGTLVTDANGNISVSSGGGAGGPYLPLSGGTMTGITQFNDHTQHGDQVSAKWGTGNDLTIKHNATDSFFENNTGHLNIVNYANDKDIVLWNDDGTGGIAKYLVLNGNSTHAYFSNPGNVGIGVTGPASKLTIDAPAGNFANGANAISLNYDGGSSGGDVGGGIVFSQKWWSASTGQQVTGGIFGIKNAGNGSYGGGLAFYTQPNGAANMAQHMVIRSTGEVGIGTTSPSSKLEVNGDIDTTGSNGYLINGMAWALENSGVLTLGDWDGNEFSTRIMDENSNEVLRVTGGRVGIGTTSPLATLHIDNPQTANGNIGMISDASAGGTGTRNIHVNLPNYGEGIRFLRSGTYSGGAMKFYSGSSNVGSVQINASSTSFNTTSDYRAKENIVAMENSINRLKELKPCRFNFLIDPENTVDGFIAHEAQEVVPEAITGEKDKLDYEGNPEYQGIDQSKLVPLLTSALQEAISKIEQLETRIQTLENN